MRNKFLGTGEEGYHPLRKLAVCWSGLFYAVRYGFSFAYKVVLSVLVLLASFLLRQWLDVLFIMTATAVVLMAELINSAIEALCDFVEWRESHKIRVIKDISAAAGGIAILLWSIAVVVEIVRLWRVFIIR
mgnify:CR=1 FL=1